MIYYMAGVLKVSSGTPFKSRWVGARNKAVAALVTMKAVDQCGHRGGRQTGGKLSPPASLSSESPGDLTLKCSS